MNIKSRYTVRIPSYAMSYIFNSDSSGLKEEDVKNIDSWINSELESNQCNIINFIITMPEEVDSYFSSHPVFGLPCDVYDCEIIIFEKES